MAGALPQAQCPAQIVLSICSPLNLSTRQQVKFLVQLTNCQVLPFQPQKCKPDLQGWSFCHKIHDFVPTEIYPATDSCLQCRAQSSFLPIQ